MSQMTFTEALDFEREELPMADNEEIHEVIVDETEPSDRPRRVRVYKGGSGDDDFFIDLPAGTRLTFGYFNPAAAKGRGSSEYDDRYGKVGEMRSTCLRVYQGKGTTNQLAAFTQVTGFRDESIKLTKLVRKVTVEQRIADDGEGTVEYGGKQQRQLTARIEDEDIPF